MTKRGSVKTQPQVICRVRARLAGDCGAHKPEQGETGSSAPRSRACWASSWRQERFREGSLARNKPLRRTLRQRPFPDMGDVKMVDKNRVEGAGDKAGGKIKEAAGKLTGDEKLRAEGKADQVKGGVKSAVGGAADALKGK